MIIIVGCTVLTKPAKSGDPYYVSVITDNGPLKFESYYVHHNEAGLAVGWWVQGRYLEDDNGHQTIQFIEGPTIDYTDLKSTCYRKNPIKLIDSGGYYHTS